MVRIPSLAVLGAIALNVSTVCGAVASGSSPSKRADGLRLVKASDEDPGTWMTEEEKYERFTYKNLGFVDITDTLVLSTPWLDLVLELMPHTGPRVVSYRETRERLPSAGGCLSYCSKPPN